MKFTPLLLSVLGLATVSLAAPTQSDAQPDAQPGPRKARHLRPVFEKRDGPQFTAGQPIDGKGKGAPFSGGTNHAIDLENPDNLGATSVDKGVVPNLKWSFSDSKVRILKGGWVREQVITDLPASKDVSAAQQHLTKGSVRELHWHRVAEWGYVYAGEILVSAVNDQGQNELTKLVVGDIWYFPKGQAHTIQGLADQNEYLLVFDDANFDAVGTTFMVDDWIAHTPKYILAKNFGVNESVFDNAPEKDPYLVEGPISKSPVDSPYGKLEGNSSYVYPLSRFPKVQVPGGGGSVAVVDSRNFPIAKTIAAAVVTLKPGALRELHWHPNADEWLYFVTGQARATVFLGSDTARTFDFSAGDTAVFPDNTGHYVENTSKDKELVWIEIYKSDRVVDISLAQWLSLTPADIVAETLKVDISVVKNIKKVKQLIIQ